tara:strand:+ start:43440 stop:43568 length:129 start_codon:yes stop_codon:yes gene_type:complete
MIVFGVLYNNMIPPENGSYWSIICDVFTSDKGRKAVISGVKR